MTVAEFLLHCAFGALVGLAAGCVLAEPERAWTGLRDALFDLLRSLVDVYRAIRGRNRS